MRSTNHTTDRTSGGRGRRRHFLTAAVTVAASFGIAVGPLGLAMAGADGGSIAGYNASTLAIAAQFGFNIPNVVPLPHENLIEDDIAFARTNMAEGPVIDALGAPYYPGDIAAQLGSLLATDGFPFPVPNDTALAESKYPNSPGYGGHASFGVSPSNATPLMPSVAYSTADASTGGGDATATVTNLALANLGAAKPLGGTTTGSLIDVGNMTSSDTTTVTGSSVVSTATSLVKAIDIAGLVNIANLTSTASASSDGTTGKPTASLRLGQVTVDGQTAYIDATGVHVSSSNPSASGITPAQLQQTVDGTLGQDGITIRILNPQLTSTGGEAAADAGGLQIAIAHQVDVPFIPGEPNIPLPQLGNQGLPAGLYTVTTSITFGLAQAAVSATSITADAFPTLPSLPFDTGGTATGSGIDSLGSGGNFGFTPSSSFGTSTTVQSVPPTGPGTGPAAQSLGPSFASSDFPIRGVPAPIGWAVAALLSVLILCYPLLLLARWQFINPRRR